MAPVVSRWAVVVSSSAFIAVVSPRSGEAPVFPFGGSGAGRDDEISSRKYEPVRYWMDAHSKRRAGGSAWSSWGIPFHIAAYPNVGKTLDATEGDLEGFGNWLSG